MSSHSPSDQDPTVVRPSSDPHATEYFDRSAVGGAQATAFSPGFVLNQKFQLERQLGRGGMGEAWKAFDTLAERAVVLKFVPKEIQHVKEAMDSVKDSFKKVHALQHQHICPVYDLFQDEQHGLCLVMKFIDGLPLDEYRRKLIEKHKTLSFSDLVQILWGVAQGLDYAHDKRVIHRDIKPQNIMVGKTDGVQIIDFGLAEEIRSSMVRFSDVTMDVAGTRPYMAPEQWQGKYQDAKTDQYALAVTAYELFSGRYPFQGTDVAVLRECVLHDAPDPIPNLPDYINDALLKALSKTREDRFENCKSFVRAMTNKPKKPEETPPEITAGGAVEINAPPVIPSLPTINLKSERPGGSDPVWKPQVLTGSTKPAGAKKKRPAWLVPGIVAAAVVVAVLGAAISFSGGGRPKAETDAKTNRARQTGTAPKKDGQDRSTKKTPAVPVVPAKPRNLSVLSVGEKNSLQQKYPELDWTGAKIVVLPEPTENGLRQAFAKAAETPENDLIVVRTTKEKHKIVLKDGQIRFECNAKENGGVTLVGLGPEKLVLDGNGKDRILLIHNHANAYFGGIVFTNGSIVDASGGAVCVTRNSSAGLFDCDVIGNACIPEKKFGHWEGFGGGGVMVWVNSSLVLRDVLFEGNSIVKPEFRDKPKTKDTKFSMDNSGALGLADGSSLAATNVVFRDNDGGALCANDMKAFELRNVSLVGNKTQGWSGAIYLYGIDPEQTYKIVNLYASGNMGGHLGGALHIAGKGRYVLDHLTLVGNAVGHDGQGGGLCFGGGGHKIQAAEATLSNSILAGNWANDFALNEEKIEKLNIRNCIVSDPGRHRRLFAEGENNRFINRADVKLGELADFGNGIPAMPLLAGSPAIDAGIATENTPETDITGRPRNLGKAPDIGAFEWQSDAADEQAEIDKFLEEFGNDVKATDDKGETLLHKAAWRGNVAAAKFLISQGADLHAKDKEGNTPLHRAAKEGRTEVVKFLVSQGADILAKGHNTWLPLHLAAHAGHVAVIDFFLDRGMDVNTKGNAGMTPLHEAAFMGHTETAKFLVSKGANVNARNSWSETPFYWAAHHGYIEIAKFLVSQGADVNIKNNKGRTPFDVAKESKRTEIVEYLTSIGKVPDVGQGESSPALSDDEKKSLQQRYPELDWAGAKITVLPERSEAGLRQAVEKALETPDNDIIVVRTTKEKCRIVLNDGQIRIESKAKEKVALSLVSLGPEKLILDGDKKDRVLFVGNGADVTLGGIVFTNGYLKDDRGAAVCIDKSTVRILHCDFINNACIPEKKRQWWEGVGGGAIAGLARTSLVLRDCRFEDNRNNVPAAFEPERPEGMLISQHSSGALLLDVPKSFSAKNVLFRNNDGGAMFVQKAGTIDLQNISMIDNRSLGGGTMHLHGDDEGETYRVANLFASGNKAGEFGGALQIGGKGRYVLDHLTLVGNFGEHGGGICLGGGGDYWIQAKEVVLSNSILTGNDAKHYQADFAICNGEKIGMVKIVDCIAGKLAYVRKVEPKNMFMENLEIMKIDAVKLGELTDFGNGIPVMPLLAESPAIDAGIVTENTPETDITGRPRQSGKAPDIGAFEFQAAPPVAEDPKKGLSKRAIEKEVAQLVVDKLKKTVRLKLASGEAPFYISTRQNVVDGFPGVVEPIPDNIEYIGHINLTPFDRTSAFDNWRCGNDSPFPCRIKGYHHHSRPCTCLIEQDDLRSIARLEHVFYLELTGLIWTLSDWEILFGTMQVERLDIVAIPRLPNWKPLEKLIQMTELSIGNNDIEPVHLESVTKLPRLVRLYARNARFEPGALKSLEGNKSIRLLDLHGGVGFTSEDLFVLNSMAALEEIRLDEAVLTDEQLLALASIKQLKKLTLRFNGISRQGLAAFREKRPDITIDMKGRTELPIRPGEVADDVKEIFLGDLLWKSAKTHFSCPGPKSLHWYDKAPLDKLWAPAPSNIAYELGKRWKKLECSIAVKTDFATIPPMSYVHMPGGDRPSIRFLVKGDGKILYESNILRNGKKIPVSIDLEGVDVLELITDDAGDGSRFDGGYWLEPKLKR